MSHGARHTLAFEQAEKILGAMLGPGASRQREALAMQRNMRQAGDGMRDGAEEASEAAAECSLRGHRAGITSDEIARAARELVAAYGPDALVLMQKRTRAVHRRGDAESAVLWRAVGAAVEQQLANGGDGGQGVAGD
jgi:hypothetical protein